MHTVDTKTTSGVRNRHICGFFMPISWFMPYGLNHDQEHMWMEFDRNDEKYPTDPRFEEHPFNQGQDVIFWRERVK